jgi:glycosyltransferase involved in cell wall biosynthesis
MNDLVTIVIPTYNRADLLPQAIESALKQTYEHTEVIVVDDGSTDNTSEVCKRYERVRYIRKRNGGIASALNCGIRSMRGEWFKWLSSDDYLQPEAVELLLRRAHDVEGKIVYSSWRMVDTRRKIIGSCPEREMDYLSFALKLMHGHIGNGSTILIHKSVFDKVGLFKESIRVGEDYDFWLRACLLYKYQFHCLAAFMLNYRVHDKQLTSQVTDGNTDPAEPMKIRHRIRKHVLAQVKISDPVLYKFLDYHMHPHAIQDGIRHIGRYFLPYAPRPIRRITLKYWFKLKKQLKQ